MVELTIVHMNGRAGIINMNGIAYQDEWYGYNYKLE